MVKENPQSSPANDTKGDEILAGKISEKLDVPPDVVKQIIHHVKAIMEGELHLKDLELYGDLGELARYINETKKSLKKFSNLDIVENELPETSDQLEGILEATEEATNQILTLTEELLQDNGAISQKILQLKESVKDQSLNGTQGILNDLDTKNSDNYNKLLSIMTACNFQDLTGQRIQKIVELVRDIESKIMTMVISFNLKIKGKDGDVDKEKIAKEEKLLEQYQADLMKGPQRKDVAVKQDEVDDLLAELGF